MFTWREVDESEVVIVRQWEYVKASVAGGFEDMPSARRFQSERDMLFCDQVDWAVSLFIPHGSSSS